ncbi:MAG: adenosine deaminase [Chloroflexia bacterium]
MPGLDPELDALIAAMPKAELHVHLEGSIRPATLLMLARRNEVDLGCDDEAGLRELYRFRDFRHFVELYSVILSTLRTPEDFALITEELGRSAAAQNTRYLEATFTLGAHVRSKGIPADELLDALSSGADASRLATGVEMRFIFDHVREHPPELCRRIAEWCVQGRDRGVVALGLSGFELAQPVTRFADAIRWAQANGIAFVPHAGEVAGPESVWEVLEFDPPRIGHGIHSIGDPALVARLRDRGIVLEICPTSNVCLNNVPILAAHPLRLFWDAGVPVTINSDDPPMFNTTLLDEYRLAASDFGFTAEELAEASLTAARSALLPAEGRARLETSFRDELRLLGLGTRSRGSEDTD